MSEPTVPTPSASEGWPPRVPTNPEPVTQPYAESASAYPAPSSSYQQFYIEKPAEILEGEKLAKTSTILGIVSLTTGLGAFIGPFAIVKAAKAERLGVDSTVGKVTGWLGTIFGALAIVITIIYIALFGALLANSDPNDFKTGGISNSKEYKSSPSGDPAAGIGGDAWDKLTPAEKAEVNQYLEEVVAGR